jgi:hypothetical protein
MLDSDSMERDMHCTDKSMLIMPRPKEISKRVKSIYLLSPSIGEIHCRTSTRAALHLGITFRTHRTVHNK